MQEYGLFLLAVLVLLAIGWGLYNLQAWAERECADRHCED